MVRKQGVDRSVCIQIRTPGAPAVSAVAPGDYVSLRAIGTPAGMEQSFGWVVGTNQNIIKDPAISLTSTQACELAVNLTIAGSAPQWMPPVFCAFPILVGVEGHDVTAPAEPSAEAITSPDGYGNLATFTYDLLEPYYASWGGDDGGRYRATAHLGSASLSGECHVWPQFGTNPEGEHYFIGMSPASPCAVCGAINFTFYYGTWANNHAVNADSWSGDGVQGSPVNTPYCSAGPIAPPGYHSIRGRIDHRKLRRKIFICLILAGFKLYKNELKPWRMVL